jgi:hypothetical protein
MTTNNVVDCGICYTPIEDDYLKTDCNHEYHKECLAYALKKNDNNECPYCRKIVNIPGVSVEKKTYTHYSYNYTPPVQSNCTIPNCAGSYYDKEKNPNMYMHPGSINYIANYKKVCNYHANVYLQKAHCSYILKSGINKGSFCENKIYNINPLTEEIAYKNEIIKTDFCTCCKHDSFTPELLKQEIKKITDKEAKAQAKLEKQKAKEEKAKAKQNAMEEDGIPISGTIEIDTAATDNQTSVEGKCKFILTRGENKGKHCSHNGIYDGYCKRHCPADKLQAIINKITN